MKRFTILALLLCSLFGFAATSRAQEKVKPYFDDAGYLHVDGWVLNAPFKGIVESIEPGDEWFTDSWHIETTEEAYVLLAGGRTLTMIYRVAADNTLEVMNDFPIATWREGFPATLVIEEYWYAAVVLHKSGGALIGHANPVPFVKSSEVGEYVLIYEATGEFVHADEYREDYGPGEMLNCYYWMHDCGIMLTVVNLKGDRLYTALGANYDEDGYPYPVWTDRQEVILDWNRFYPVEKIDSPDGQYQIYRPVGRTLPALIYRGESWVYTNRYATAPNWDQTETSYYFHADKAEWVLTAPEQAEFWLMDDECFTSEQPGATFGQLNRDEVTWSNEDATWTVSDYDRGHPLTNETVQSCRDAGHPAFLEAAKANK